MANISPAGTWAGEELVLNAAVAGDTDRLAAREPDYTQWIDARLLRRMSRILKMGVTAGFAALKEAGIQSPDAIITGTGYGCLEDTGVFITKMVENHEEALNPTPFIQSTHNTIGSQIALQLGCQGYNQTYTQGVFSFENALLDAMMYIGENPTHNVLAGGVDEITDISHTILKRFGLFRGQARVPQGEGAAYVVLSAKKPVENPVALREVVTLYKASEAIVRAEIEKLLLRSALHHRDIDTVLIGTPHSLRTEQYAASLFPESTKIFYKQACGEYPTATAFGFGLALQRMRSAGTDQKPAHHAIVWNQFAETHQSLILLSR
jgi:hypothetical protein